MTDTTRSAFPSPEKDNRKRRLIALLYTLLYVSATLVMMTVCKWEGSPPPSDEGEGLLVDFGTTDIGLGTEQASAGIPQVNIPSPGNPPLTQEVDEAIIVQDHEETIDIEQPKPSKDKSDKTKPKVEKLKMENLLKSQVKSNKISKNNTSTPPQNDQPSQKVNKEALFSGFGDNGNSGNSQGERQGTGNMGSKNGFTSGALSGDATGMGSQGSGRGMIGSGLKGRKLDNIPKLVDNSNKTGKIIISVKVDNLGRVISAEYKAQGSTITDNDLIDKCEQIAKKAKFTPSQDIDIDRGTLVFNFVVR